MKVVSFSYAQIQSSLNGYIFNNIGKIGLISFALLLLLSYLAILSDHTSWSNLFQIFAVAGLNVWITLTIVEKSRQKDKDRQWKKTKIFTYRRFIRNIEYICIHSIDCAPLMGINREELAEFGSEFGTEQNDKVALAIIKHANLMRKKMKDLDSDTIIGYAKDKDFIDKFKKFINETDDFFDEIIYSLIPRVQFFSIDDHLNIQLLELEIHYRHFKSYMNGIGEFELAIAFMLAGYINLIKKLGLVYDEIRRELQQETPNNERETH